MTPLTSVSPQSFSAADPDRARRLRDVAQQLEGVFVERLFAAMRETVPRDGALAESTGEEMFTSMLDQRMASVAPLQWHHGLGEALVRQLQSALDRQAGAPPGGSQP